MIPGLKWWLWDWDSDCGTDMMTEKMVVGLTPQGCKEKCALLISAHFEFKILNKCTFNGKKQENVHFLRIQKMDKKCTFSCFNVLNVHFWLKKGFVKSAHFKLSAHFLKIVKKSMKKMKKK